MPEPDRISAHPQPAPAMGRSRRGFIQVAGIALAGGTALGLPEQAAAASSQAAGASSRMALARSRVYGDLAEVVASVRNTGHSDRSRAEAVGAARSRLAGWYAAASPSERIQVDDTLDVVAQAFTPGAFTSQLVCHRLKLLAEQLNGPHEAQLTAAVGLAVAGLNGSPTSPAQAHTAGRLYARTIRALPAQHGPGHIAGVVHTGDHGAMCAPNTPRLR